MKRKEWIATITIAVIFAGITISIAGCDIGDVLRVKTPTGIQQSEGISPSLTLNEAELQYKLWYTQVRSEGNAWKSNIARSNEISGMLMQLATAGLENYGPMLGGIPVVGPIAMPLGMLGMYVFGRRKMGAEKQASFNKGKSEAERLLKETL